MSIDPREREKLQQTWNRLMRQHKDFNTAGNYLFAIDVGEAALRIADLYLSKKELDLNLHSLAGSYKYQGLYARSEQLYNRSLGISELLFGREHTEYAKTLTGLAGLYCNQEYYDLAKDLFLQSLRIAQNVLSPENDFITVVQIDLADLYVKQGLYDLAEPIYLQALVVTEEELSSDNIQVAHILNSLASLYEDKGLYEKVESLYQRALKIKKKVLGNKHPDVAITLNGLADFYKSQGLYDQVESLYQRALAINQEVLGNEHRSVASTLHNLASFYQTRGLYTQAELFYQKALAITEKVLGLEHTSTAKRLNNLASLYKDQGLYEKVESLYLQALAINRKVLGDEHPEIAAILNNLANLYQAQGLYDKVEPLYLQALAINTKILGKDHPNVASTLSSLASLYKTQGLYDKVESLYLQALAINTKILGKDHPDVASILNNLASFYDTRGLYDKVEPLYLEALAINEKASGKDHLDVAQNLNNLASFYETKCLYNRAESYYLRSLAINEKTLGLEHPITASTLNNLAGLYQAQGLCDKAELLFIQALEIQQKILSKDHPKVAITLNNLANLYSRQGDYKLAESFYQQALKIQQKILGKDHPEVATTLGNQGYMYLDLGREDQAKILFERALSINEKAFGKDHPGVAKNLSYLAKLYLKQEKYDQVEKLCQQGLLINEKAFGKDHLGITSFLNVLAVSYLKQKLYDQAESFFQQAIAIDQKILGIGHPHTCMKLNNLAACYCEQGFYGRAKALFIQALETLGKTLEKTSPDFTFILNNLAALYRKEGFYEQSLKEYQIILIRQYNSIRGQLAHISEGEHTAYLKEIKLTLEYILSLVYQHFKTSPSAIAIAFNAVLLTKNLSASALAARNAIIHSGKPELQARNKRIGELIAESNNLPYNDVKQAQISSQILEIEADIARLAPDIALPDSLEVDYQAISLKLPQDSTLVEFVSLNVRNFEQKNQEPARYLAFIISSDNSDQIQMIDLGLAAEIDDLIHTCRQNITNIYKSSATAGACIPDEIIAEVPPDQLELVKSKIIAPLHLDRSPHVIIAPDGALSFLPFQLFLLNCLVSYLSTGRDLVRIHSQKSPGSSLVIADPDFANTPSQLHLISSNNAVENDFVSRFENSSRERLQVAGLKDLNKWQPLTSFGILGRTIAQKLQVPSYKQRLATKTKLVESKCPHILSILTHGFSLAKTDEDELDPMARSGLTFCGANHGRDYIMFANEVATLDLHSNELTLLVACQTALGDVQAGEGVYGLRRAFAIAGAKTLIATLWEIPVYASIILIERFLDNLERNVGKAAALKEAQTYLREISIANLKQLPAGHDALAELGKLHGKSYHLNDSHQPFTHPYFWAAWICQGDTGTMRYLIAKNLGQHKVNGQVTGLRVVK